MFYFVDQFCLWNTHAHSILIHWLGSHISFITTQHAFWLFAWFLCFACPAYKQNEVMSCYPNHAQDQSRYHSHGIPISLVWLTRSYSLINSLTPNCHCNFKLGNSTMDNNDTDESNVKKEHRKDGIPLSLRVSLHS